MFSIYIILQPENQSETGHISFQLMFTHMSGGVALSPSRNIFSQFKFEVLT